VHCCFLSNFISLVVLDIQVDSALDNLDDVVAGALDEAVVLLHELLQLEILDALLLLLVQVDVYFDFRHDRLALGAGHARGISEVRILTRRCTR